MSREIIYEKIEKTKCFLLDMDGTVYLGNELLPGARDFLDLLDERGIQYLFLTNNSSKSGKEYAGKLTSLGIDVPASKILTSGEATAIYLKKNFDKSSLYVIGTPSLIDTFTSVGLSIKEDNPDIVVLGFDTTLTYEKLWKCCDLVREGKKYIATHPDINCPTEAGFMPDIGSFIALIESSTGRVPDEIVGKPYAPMVEAIRLKTGLEKKEIMMVGDRIYTDIAMGRAGIGTILVLSGEANISDVENSEIKPDYIMKDLSELVGILK